MSIYDDFHQDQSVPTVADVELVESTSGDLRRAIIRVVRQEIVEAFDEGYGEYEDWDDDEEDEDAA